MSEYGTIIETGTVRFERLLPGPIERVWSYLVDPDKRGTWLARGAMEPREGGKVELQFLHSELTPHAETIPEKYKGLENGHTMTGRVTQWAPPRFLAYTWPEGSDEESEVSFELTRKGEQILLVVTHRRLGDRSEMLSVAGGWHVHLGILADRLAGREPGPFWATHAALEAEYARRIPAA